MKRKPEPDILEESGPFYQTERGRMLAELKARMGWPLIRYYKGQFVWRGDRWDYLEPD